MKCLCCGGEMESGKAPLRVDRKGIHVTLDEVAAWVCSECGEPVFESAEVDLLQAIARAVEREIAKGLRKDPVIERIREVRHAISEECGHDAAKLLEYYRRREETRGRKSSPT